MRKQRQSNNKVATKNTERLCMALLGLRIEQNLERTVLIALNQNYYGV